MRKIVIILFLGLFALTACNNQNNDSSKNEDESAATEQSAGGEKDAHGCLIAAGETWSELQQNCIQVFNVGQRLNPVGAKDGDPVISAFILMNDDKSKAELFMPDNKSNTTILDKSGDNTYENGEYKFDAKEAVLFISGEKKYVGNTEQ